jgi:hypothetical protein
MSKNFKTFQHENTAMKAGAQIALSLLVALLVGAILFYKERMLFIDAPHVLFRVVNDGRFHIEEQRYGSFITQLFPLLSAKLHMPFKALVVLYSCSFYLFYLAIVLLLVYKYRNYSLAILFGLYLTIFVSDTFYWPNNEVHQGMAWLMLAFALNYFVALKNRPLLVAVFLFALFFALAVWTHPLVMLVAIYLWFFFWLDKAHWPYSRIQSIIFTGILLLLSFLKYYQGAHHGYDSTKIEMVTHFDIHKLTGILASPQLHYFVKGCIINYWLFVLLFVAGLTVLLKERKYLLFTWTLLCASGYLVLICLTFWDITSNRFYIESEYMPLSIIGCAPFVYYVLPRLGRWQVITIMLLIFVTRLYYIYNSAPLFTGRVVQIEKIQTKMKEKNLAKIIIPGPVKEADDVLIMNWGAPVESIVFSKLNSETPQRTFIFIDQGQSGIAAKVGKDTLLGCWEKRPVSQLNSYYFRVDTTTAYQVINYSALMQ